MTSKAKAANYSDTEINAMTAAYNGAYSNLETVSAESNKKICGSIALEMNRSIPQIRSKLASLGIYRKAESVAKAAKKGGKKADIIASITNAGVTLNSMDAEGLEKATGNALSAVLVGLTNQGVRIIELENELYGDDGDDDGIEADGE